MCSIGNQGLSRQGRNWKVFCCAVVPWLAPARSRGLLCDLPGVRIGANLLGFLSYLHNTRIMPVVLYINYTYIIIYIYDYIYMYNIQSHTYCTLITCTPLSLHMHTDSPAWKHHENICVVSCCFCYVPVLVDLSVLIPSQVSARWRCMLRSLDHQWWSQSPWAKYSTFSLSPEPRLDRTRSGDNILIGMWYLYINYMSYMAQSYIT